MLAAARRGLWERRKRGVCKGSGGQEHLPCMERLKLSGCSGMEHGGRFSFPAQDHSGALIQLSDQGKSSMQCIVRAFGRRAGPMSMKYVCLA